MNVYLIGDRERKRKRAPVPGCSIRNLKPVFIVNVCVSWSSKWFDK